MSGVGAAHDKPIWETFKPQVVTLKAKDVMDDGGKLEKLVGDAVLDSHELTEIAGADGVVSDKELQDAGFSKVEDRQAILKAIGTNTAKTGFDPIGMRFDGFGKTAPIVENTAVFSPIPGSATATAVALHPLFGAGSVADFGEMEAKKFGHLIANIGKMFNPATITSAEDLHHALEHMVKDAMASFGSDSVVAGLIAGAANKITHMINTIAKGAQDAHGHFDAGKLTGMIAISMIAVAVQAVPGVNVAVDGVMALVAGADAAKELKDAFHAVMDQFQGKEGASGFRTGAEIGEAAISVAMTALAVVGVGTAAKNTGKILEEGADVAHVMTHAMGHTVKGYKGAEITHVVEQVSKLLNM